MRIFKYSVATLLLLLAIAATVFVAAPGVLVRPVASYYLGASGFQLLEFSGLVIRQGYSTIEHLKFRDATTVISLNSARATYSLAQLTQGSLDTLDIGNLQLELLATEPAITSPPSNTAEATTSEQLNSLLHTLQSLPLNSVSVGQMDIRTADLELHGNLRLAIAPIYLEGEFTSPEFENLALTLSATTEAVATGNRITASALLVSNTQELARSDISLLSEHNSIQALATTHLDILSLQQLERIPSLLPGLSSSTEAVTVTSELTLDDISTNPIISNLSLGLDTPDHILNVKWQSDGAQLDARLNLPVRIAGGMATPTSDVILSVSTLAGNTSYTDEATAIQSAIEVATIDATCSLSFYCSGNTAIALTIPALAGGGLVGENLTVAGDLEFTTSSSGNSVRVPHLTITTNNSSLHHIDSDTSLALDITTSDIAINCDASLTCNGSGAIDLQSENIITSSITAQSANINGLFDFTYSPAGIRLSIPTAVLQLSTANIAETGFDTRVQFTDALVVTGDQPSLRFSFVSEQLALDLTDVTLKNPAYFGSVNYTGNALQSSVNLSLANQLHTRIDTELALDTGTGILNWELPEYTFSKITPVSALVTQSFVEGDIVSGSIAGNAALSISTDTDGNMQFDGPATIRINDIGGFAGETFFVGFTTELRTLVSGSGNISTTENLSARINTLDPGVPLSNIRWNYGFDSANQRIHVTNLEINTLGGQITVADFDYNTFNPDSTLTVVLTNLDLQTIVDLAQYPGLSVQGLISGYIPVNIVGDNITVDNGLVGALQPGGTIRYLSGNVGSTGNSSLDLMNQALANYHYQIMNTRVYYNDVGDLRLEVQLLGNNPDLYNGQVVNLNVNIDDNIPSLLRSLQASRTITDELEQQLQSRRQTSNGQR